MHLLILPSLWDWAAQAADINPAHIRLRDDFATHDPLVEQIGLALWAAAATEDHTSDFYTEALTHTLALHMLHNYTVQHIRVFAPPPAVGRRFQRALDYIDEHLAETLSMETLAAIEGLSPYHFARMFKNATGQSPHQYVIVRRVECARHLLNTTKLSLAQIAVEAGFANQSHLTRHFKRVVGVTPGDYRAL